MAKLNVTVDEEFDEPVNITKKCANWFSWRRTRELGAGQSSCWSCLTIQQNVPDILTLKTLHILSLCVHPWLSQTWLFVLWNHCPNPSHSFSVPEVHAHTGTYLGQTEAGLHADFVETLLLFQDVCQSQSGGRSWELFQSWDGLLLAERWGQSWIYVQILMYCTEIQFEYLYF